MPGFKETAPPPILVKEQIRTLFLRALLLRIATALIIHFVVANDLTFAPDQISYHQVGTLVAQSWASDVVLPASTFMPSGPQGYYYIVGFLYFIFGADSLFPKLVNCLVGASLVPLSFDLARRMGAPLAAAIRAATLVAWFPSLVLWSGLNIRDAWIMFLIAGICRQALVLQERFGLFTLLSLGGALLALTQFRPYILLPIAGPLVVSFFVRNSQNVIRNAFFGMVAAMIVSYADESAGRGRNLRTLDFAELQETRYWNTVGASSQFQQADISTPTKALVFLPVGLANFLLAPFPWMLGSIRQILAVPETLFFYWLLPWIFRGMRRLLRDQFGASLLPILVTTGLTIGYALGEGNAGTAYRHRAQLLVFFLTFASVGLEYRKSQSRATPRIPERALPKPA